MTDLAPRVRSFATTHAVRLRELWRYYKIGVINAAFGFGCYSLLIFLGVNIYVAQLLAHVTGVAFNYFTYTRHVFQDSRPHISRFLGAYVVNYFIGLGFLSVCLRLTPSPYIAGFLALVAASFVNYGLLKFFVFTRQKAPP